MQKTFVSRAPLLYGLRVTQTLFWNLGKFLQLIALIQAPYALYVGLSTNDARLELKYLLLAVIQFLMGVLLVKASARAE